MGVPERQAASERDHPRTAAAAIAVLGALAVAAGIAPWVRLSLPTGVEIVSGLEAPYLWLPVALPAVILVLLGLAGLRAFTPERRHMGLVAGAIVTVVAGGQIAMIESVAGVLPTEALPRSISRANAGIQAGAGLWLAASCGLMAVVAMASARVVRDIGRAVQRALRDRRPAALLAVLWLVASLPLIGVLRYQPWLTVSAAGEQYSLEPWALPWVGPLSLVPMWGLGLALVLLVLGRTELGALVAAFSGWVLTFAAGVCILASNTLGDLGVQDLAPAALEGLGLEVVVGWPVWAAFALGLSVAGAAAHALSIRTPAGIRVEMADRST